MSPIHPFQISIPSSALITLKTKLSVSTFPTPVSFSDFWSYGTPFSKMKDLAAYWEHEFDWRAQEKKLNDSLPQFTTMVNVEGFGELEMHFVHKRSEKAGSIPLLFCHGWPGSFLEVSKILPLLTENESGQSFHVVAPSLPNFGFSQGVNKPGFGRTQYGEAIHQVMLALGYDKYVTQGGDWAVSITRILSTTHASSVLATHLNSLQIHSSDIPKYPAANAAEEEGLQRTRWFQDQGYGYNLLQSTKPSTIGFALRDPVSLLAWIYEKLHDWTDAYPWTNDEILTWISIYQFSRAGPEASVRIYYESTHSALVEKEEKQLYGYNKQAKLGLSIFPKDLNVLPSAYGRTWGDVVFERRHERGGHFAAWEVPGLLVGDLREMFAGEGMKGVVEELVG